MVERKNRLTGQNLGPASGGAEFLADADDVLLKAIGSAASGANSLPDPYGALMDAAPGNPWDPTLGAGGPGLDQLQRAVQGGLDTAGGALETADAAAIRAILAGGGAVGAGAAGAGRGIASGAESAGRGIGTGAQWAGQGIASGAEAAGRGIGAGGEWLGRGVGSGASAGARGLTQGVQGGVGGMLSGGEAAGRGIADFTTAGVDGALGLGAGAGRGIGDGAQWVARLVADLAKGGAKGTASGASAALRGLLSGGEAAGRGVADFVTGGVDQAGNNLRGLANLLGADFGPGGGPPTDGVRADDPNRSRPLDDRDAVYQKMYQEQQAALINQLFPGAGGAGGGGGSAMGLAEQLAGEDRGYAQDRYGDMETYLGSQRERAGGQFDSDEEAILGQLRQQDQERRDAEGWYEANRKAEFGETERKLDARTSAASARLNNLGIDPTKYTEMVGTEMGALLGAQMQSGSDLAHRMSQLGAERARLGMGRAKSGFAKERRQFDADASDMLFQGSQRLSYELQDINNALMNRRITGAEAKDAAAAAANEAQMQAQRAMHFGTSQLGMDPVAAAATSSIPGSMNKMIDAAPTGRTITITEGMLPPEWNVLIGEELSIENWAKIIQTLKTQSETLNN